MFVERPSASDVAVYCVKRGLNACVPVTVSAACAGHAKTRNNKDVSSARRNMRPLIPRSAPSVLQKCSATTS